MWVLIEPIDGGDQMIVFKRAFKRWDKVHEKRTLPDDQRSRAGRKVYRIVAEAETQEALPSPTVAAPFGAREIPVPVLPKNLERDVVAAPVPVLPEKPVTALSDETDATSDLDPAGDPVRTPAVNKGGRPKKIA